MKSRRMNTLSAGAALLLAGGMLVSPLWGLQQAPRRPTQPLPQTEAPAQQAQPAPQHKQAKVPKHQQKAERAQREQPASQAHAQKRSKHERSAGEQTARASKSARVIPPHVLQAKFGPQHRFHISKRVTTSSGQVQFYYVGYWFEVVQPWPAYWSWNDAFYINYMSDGYYLCDPLYPQVYVAVIVVNA
jgi:hypothetical protein